jgi:hypothetical protein
MSRFGAQGPGGTTSYFGQQDEVAGLFGSGTAAGTSTLTGNGTVQNIVVITGTVPTNPIPGQTGVLVNGVNFGLVEGSITYNGLSLVVANWADTQIEVTWPDIQTGSTFNFQTPSDLIVDTSQPFSVQTNPDPDYQYVLIGTRNAGLVEGLFDDDITASAPDSVEGTYVYGVSTGTGGTPDDTGVEYHLDEHYINQVPLNGWSFDYRRWDGSTWSNLADERYYESAGGTTSGTSSLSGFMSWRLGGFGTFAGGSGLQADPRIGVRIIASGTVAGTSSLQGSGILVGEIVASGTLAGTSVLQGLPSIERGGFGTLPGTSTLTTDTRAIYKASGQLDGTSTLFGNTQGGQPAAGTLAGTSTLVADSTTIRIASGTLPGTSIAQGDGRIFNKIPASGTAAGTSTVSAVTKVVTTFVASGTVPGTSTATGTADIKAFTSGTMSGSSGLTGPPRIIRRPLGRVDGTSILAGDANIPGNSIGPIDVPGTISNSPTWGIEGKKYYG